LLKIKIKITKTTTITKIAEPEFLKYAKEVASKNQLFRSYIGMGYHNCHVPTVIQRNVFENPGW
jgi:glycine dehydrogenase